MSSLDECVFNATQWYNALVELYGPPGECIPLPGIFISATNLEGGTVSAHYCGDFYFDCEFTWEDTLPPDYCEDQMCTCAAELNGITTAIENLSTTVNESLGTMTSVLNLIQGDTFSIASGTGSIASGLTPLSTIATATGVQATAQTFIGTQLDLIEGYQAIQSVAQPAMAAALGTLATEVPLLVVATEQNALNTGAVASNVGLLTDFIPIATDIESDLFSIAGSALDIEDTLNAIEECICADAPDALQWYVQLDGPTPTSNSAASAGGAGKNRWFPYAGVTFQPLWEIEPEIVPRIGEIHWCTYESSLVPYPPGGPARWTAIIVPSPAISADEITKTDIQL